ncbi:MAG: ABC transporter permease subunit [Gammaproteobacteria bacterium]
MGETAPIISGQTSARRRVWRRLRDRFTAHAVAVGGVGVIVAILLIFIYLLYVVAPLFRSPHAQVQAAYALPGGTAAATLALTADEYGEIGLRITSAGQAIFFRTADGAVLKKVDLPTGGATAGALGAGEPGSGVYALALAGGRALVFRQEYGITYEGNVRRSEPRIGYPLGEAPVEVDGAGHALAALDVQARDGAVRLAAITDDARVLLVEVRRAESLFGDDAGVEIRRATLATRLASPARIVLSQDMRTVFLAGADGDVEMYDAANPEAPRLLDTTPVVADGTRITALEILAGGISLLVGDSTGRIAQWFPVRDDQNRYKLTRIREFQGQQAPITAIGPEYARKGFLAADSQGGVGLYHTTAERTILTLPAMGTAIPFAAMTARADAALLEDASGRLSRLAIDNPHPEVSFKALWGRVWYESRQHPEFIWQSSSAANDFEPKFSLTPLAFGTLKASLYAMLFAVPLAIAGAVYAGYFMSPRMRGLVKPTIEVMAAIPTVILGFLAGLWLAPIVEHNLAGVMLAFVFPPLATLLAAAFWSRLPASVRGRVGDGWEGALLVPVIVAAVAAAIQAGHFVEARWFGGDLPAWLTQEIGIDFDQRNSLVVGIMMGFAVIPTVFSISEDAVVGVPRNLTVGSLALGATPWQTLVRVVLLTASPGIFSAVMIGLGRAVGETMIVLMATGNTPVIDMSLFQGFRALSANIAVEMPESAVGSTHYRILFLAALVLFAVTFLFNTVAELVRQRLRGKYATL